MSNYGSASDEAIFCVDKLLALMGADEHGVEGVSKIVRRSIGPGVDPLNLAGEAIRDARLTEACRILHNQRSALAGLGAKRFVAASLALELALNESRLMEVPVLFAAVEGELKLVLEHAGAWLDRHNGRNASRF
ncbi:Hpt domain-containing protein [Pseudoduganella violacea]|uniref:Hpt domain-containing protein n=1 Tax=Pseudoduganella violacea TaxID=1715466 RepID=A0A7W5BB70_9BURK|nr:Hpt domain-containing protein [Pseudoduganella violacea]MBB3119952.1 hypothetical protein [Pseudoduganella violacea]